MYEKNWPRKFLQLLIVVQYTNFNNKKKNKIKCSYIYIYWIRKKKQELKYKINNSKISLSIFSDKIIKLVINF